MAGLLAPTAFISAQLRADVDVNTQAETRVNADRQIQILETVRQRQEMTKEEILEKRKAIEAQRLADQKRVMEKREANRTDKMTVDGRAVTSVDTMEIRAEQKERLQTRHEELAENRQTVRSEMEEKRRELIEERESRIEERQEQRDERRQELEERAKERIEAHIEKLVARFEAAIERLVGLSIRIESRIEKFSENGADTSRAETSLEMAKAKIREAQNSLASAAVLSIEILEGETPGEALTRARREFENAKQAVKDAHSALINAVEALKISADARVEVNTESDEN